MIITLGTTPAVQRSMTFDRIKIDGVNRTADVQQYASGKSINAARVLHTLGNPVLTIGFAGGNAGTFLRQDLDRAGIAHDLVDVESQTRQCTTVVNRADGTATELIEESKELPGRAFDELLEKLEQNRSNADAILLAGSLPPHAPNDFYAACTMSANDAKKFVILDAAGAPLQSALAARPTVIKPNRHELFQTVNLPVEKDEDLKIAIRQLIAMGPLWVVVTNGAKETVASNGEKFWKVSTPKVAVVSPIGSGDSFAAGLISGVVAGQSIPQACRLAAACGAANAMTARAGHLNKSDVDDLLGSITIAEF